MNKIIDIHSHLLPGVDDGSKDLDESIHVLNVLSEKGICDIVLTSHYIENSKYCINKKIRKELLETLQQQVKENIHLYLGNEVFTCENIISLLKKGEITTLNGSKYLLMELPLNGYLYQLPTILCELSDHGIVPIIAHPERYRFLHQHPERVRELLEFNCLLQCNVDSILGKYGKSAKKVMKWLLKNHLVSFVGTDTHSINDTIHLDKAYQKLKKLVGEQQFEELTYSNPLKVLKNEKIQSCMAYTASIE